MSRPMLSEWSGSELLYVEPRQVIRSFGYDNRVQERTPKSDDYRKQQDERTPEAEGAPAPARLEYPDAESASRAVKAAATELGAEMVGITRVDPHHVYKREVLSHEYAIVVAVSMGFDAIRRTPSEASDEEIMRAYNETGRIATELAKMIRARGYAARAHTRRTEQLNMLPLAYAAGLGELGKHGSLINSTLGSSFRLAVTTTELPLAVDSPRPEGLEDLCAHCNMCVKFCPGDAIADEKSEVRGVLKWVVDTEKCAPYWGSYFACGICLMVCPVNAKAFGGALKRTYIETIKAIDLPRWREELKQGLQEPWSTLERPKEFAEGWRRRVKNKESAAG